VANHRVLTREEEVALFQRLEAGDMAAREELISCNLRFVVKVALQYKGLGLPLADLIQEGNVGLVTVVDKFDWRRGYRFSTYAAFWIRQEIQAAVRRRGSLIRLPVRKARLLGKISDAISRFHQAEGRDPNLDELADFMGIEAERIEPLLPFREAMLSLEAERGDEGATLMDEVAEQDAPAPYERLAAEQTREALLKAMTVLNDREREVMFHRYGLAEGGRALSLRKTSALVGLSQEGVRRVERRALGKLGRPGLSQSLRPLLDVA
jgi:RNA polymerase primary sigma factor